MKLPRLRPHPPEPRPVTNQQIREGLAAIGELPDEADRAWFRLERADARAQRRQHDSQ